MSTGVRSSEFKVAVGCVAAGVVLAGGGVYLAVVGFGSAGVAGIVSGALLSAGSAVGYALSRATVKASQIAEKASQAVAFRHRQL